MKYYLVTFDRSPNRAYGPFHDDFVAREGIRKWWHYIKSCYIIGTEELGANDISDHFTDCAQRHGISSTHLVIAIDPSKRQGRLVKEAWDWIRKAAARKSD